MREYEKPENARGHVWAKHEDGRVDIFAYEFGRYHNGPACINCGYGFCHHCHKLPEKECTAIKIAQPIS